MIVIISSQKIFGSGQRTEIFFIFASYIESAYIFMSDRLSRVVNQDTE